MTPAGFPDRAAFEAARERVRAHAYHTPLLTSRTLSTATGFDVRLKAEMLQRTGSYKIRGPLNKFPLLSEEERRCGVICSSAGNHAQGVALAARIHGIRAVVVMARNATPSKVAATRGYGAEVIQHGSIWDEANEEAQRLVRERGLTYIHPFDDLQLIAGQGTIGLEIAADCPGVATVAVPVGGGGLSSGVATAIKALAPRARVVTVEPEGAAKLARSLAEGRRVTLEKTGSIADGLITLSVGALNWEHLSRYVDQAFTVSEGALRGAVRYALERLKLVVEPSGAATLAWLLGQEPGAAVGPVVLVLSGGNVEWEGLVALLAEGA